MGQLMGGVMFAAQTALKHPAQKSNPAHRQALEACAHQGGGQQLLGAQGGQHLGGAGCAFCVRGLGLGATTAWRCGPPPKQPPPHINPTSSHLVNYVVVEARHWRRHGGREAAGDGIGGGRGVGEQRLGLDPALAPLGAGSDAQGTDRPEKLLLAAQQHGKGPVGR